MIVSSPDQQQIKIKADSYEIIQSEKSRQQLKQVFSRYQKARSISLDLDKISSHHYDNAFINQVLKDQLNNINRFDAVVDIRIKDLLSFHYDGTLISHSHLLTNKQSSSLLSRNNISNVHSNLNKENKLQVEKSLALENHIIYIDYIVYQEFEINVSFRILNDISPAQDSKQVIENVFYYLSNIINFSLSNVLSIENILLTQMKIKIYQQQFKIDCSFGKVKFHSLLQDELSSYSYCIIRLMKIFSANEIDLYVDEDTMHELLEHLFHEDNRLKAKSINSLKIKAFSKLDQKKSIQLNFDGDSVKIEYGSDTMQIPSYTLENLFTAFDENNIKIVFKELKTTNCLKELKRILKYANIFCHSNLEIISQNQEFFIQRTQLYNNKAVFKHNLSFTGNDFSIKEISQNSYIVSQYPEIDCNEIGESINKYIVSIFNHINLSLYRYFYYIDTPNKTLEQAIKQQEEQSIMNLINLKCFMNILDIRINNYIINHKLINHSKHSLLAFLKSLKANNKLKILRKEIIQEIFMLYLEQKD